MDWFKKLKQKLKSFKKIGVFTYVGLDVLETSFPQYVVLHKTKKTFSLYDCGRIFNRDEVLGKIKDLNVKVAVSIPRDKVIVRVMDISYQESQSLVEVIMEHAEQAVPFALGELFWKYFIIKKSKNKAVVIFCAVTKEKSNQYAQELKGMGLKNVVMTASTLSYVNTFLFNHCDELSNKSYLLVDIGMRQLELCIIEDGVLVLTRSLNLGIEYMLRMLMDKFDIDFPTAQKVVFGAPKNKEEPEAETLLNETVVREVFHVWTERVLREIELAKRFYASKYAKKIDSLVMSGCPIQYGYDLDYIANVMSKHFDLETMLLDPLKNAILDHQSLVHQEDLQQINSLAIPMGLALQLVKQAPLMINLNGQDKDIREESSYWSHMAGQKNKVLAIGVGIILCVLAAQSYFIKKSQIKKNKVLKSEYVLSQKQAVTFKKKIKKQKEKLGRIHIPQSLFLDVHTYFSQKKQEESTLRYEKYLFQSGKGIVYAKDAEGQEVIEEVTL